MNAIAMETKRTRTPLSYWTATLVCRGYMTAVLGVMAAFGADSWRTAGIMLAVGILIDWRRNRVAADLRQTPQQLAKTIISNAGDPDAVRRLRAVASRQLWWPLGVFWGYTIIVLVVDTILGSDRMSGYFELFTPLYDVIASFSDATRRNAGQLAALGFESRIPVMEHVRAVVFTMLISTLYLYSTRTAYLFAISNEKMLPGVSNDLMAYRKTVRKLEITLVPFVLVGYWVLSLMVNVTTKPDQSAKYAIHMTNLPFVIDLLCFSVFGWLLLFAYSGLIFVRAQSDLLRCPSHGVATRAGAS